MRTLDASAITCFLRRLRSPRRVSLLPSSAFGFLRLRRFASFGFAFTGTHLLLRRQHHHHLPALEPGELLDQTACASRSLLHPLQQPHAELLVRHLAAAEAQRHLRLVALVEELDQLAELDLVVALVGAGAELDFLDLDLLLLELRLVGLLLLAVAELAVVHQLADRRHRQRRDLHQVHVLLFRHAQRIGDGHDAELLSVVPPPAAAAAR